MLCICLSFVDDRNDKLKFEDLYHRYKDATLKRALRMLPNNPYDAEDAFQSAWMQIARQMDKLDGKDDRMIATYILKTLEYRVIDIVNKNKEWDEEIQNVVVDPENYETDDMLYSVCAKGSKKKIVQIIKAMDPIYRDVLLLYFMNDLDIKEIAEVLGESEKTVWTRFYRGKSFLLKKLKEADVSYDG